MQLWYVIQTKPKKEDEAQSYLSIKGVEIFNPLMESFAQRNGTMNKELKPLFLVIFLAILSLRKITHW